MDFRLDISFTESGPVIPDLLRITSDNCLQTCQTACTSCKTDGTDDD
jgi:FxLD family lantipeptide